MPQATPLVAPPMPAARTEAPMVVEIAALWARQRFGSRERTMPSPRLTARRPVMSLLSTGGDQCGVPAERNQGLVRQLVASRILCVFAGFVPAKWPRWARVPEVDGSPCRLV